MSSYQKRDELSDGNFFFIMFACMVLFLAAGMMIGSCHGRDACREQIKKLKPPLTNVRACLHSCQRCTDCRAVLRKATQTLSSYDTIPEGLK